MGTNKNAIVSLPILPDNFKLKSVTLASNAPWKSIVVTKLLYYYFFYIVMKRWRFTGWIPVSNFNIEPAFQLETHDSVKIKKKTVININKNNHNNGEEILGQLLFQPNFFHDFSQINKKSLQSPISSWIFFRHKCYFNLFTV